MKRLSLTRLGAELSRHRGNSDDAPLARVDNGNPEAAAEAEPPPLACHDSRATEQARREAEMVYVGSGAQSRAIAQARAATAALSASSDAEAVAARQLAARALAFLQAPTSETRRTTTTSFAAPPRSEEPH